MLSGVLGSPFRKNGDSGNPRTARELLPSAVSFTRILLAASYCCSSELNGKSEKERGPTDPVRTRRKFGRLTVDDASTDCQVYTGFAVLMLCKRMTRFENGSRMFGCKAHPVATDFRSRFGRMPRRSGEPAIMSFTSTYSPLANWPITHVKTLTSANSSACSMYTWTRCVR
jgi:hypothetical protein